MPTVKPATASAAVAPPVGAAAPVVVNSAQAVTIHRGINAHAQLIGSMESNRGNSPQAWAAALEGAGRFQGRSGGVNPIADKQLDLATYGATDQQLRDAAARWVQSNAQPGGPLAGYAEAEKARATEGVERFLIERRQFAGPKLFHPSADPTLAAPGQGAALAVDELAAYQAAAVSQLDTTFAAAGLAAPRSSKAQSLYDTQRARIDQAVEYYADGMLNVEELTTERGIREVYLGHLEANPGDIVGAHDAVRSSLSGVQGSKITDEVMGSYPPWWPF